MEHVILNNNFSLDIFWNRVFFFRKKFLSIYYPLSRSVTNLQINVQVSKICNNLINKISYILRVWIFMKSEKYIFNFNLLTIGTIEIWRDKQFRIR